MDQKHFRMANILRGQGDSGAAINRLSVVWRVRDHNKSKEKGPQVMSEPITVVEALKALRMAQEACNKATPGPWYAHGGYLSAQRNVVGSIYHHRELGAAELLQSVPFFNPEDAAFCSAARVVLPGMVEWATKHMHKWYDRRAGYEDFVRQEDEAYPAIATILAWARTREEWSK